MHVIIKLFLTFVMLITIVQNLHFIIMIFSAILYLTLCYRNYPQSYIYALYVLIMNRKDTNL